MSARTPRLPRNWRDAPLRLHLLGPAAAVLAGRGHKVVLLGGDGKRPLGDAAGQPHGWKDATDDLAVLEARLRLAGTRAVGLGVLVGGAGGPVVVDADGPCAVQRLREILGEELDDLPGQRTRKGLHAFFAPDPTVRRSVRGIPVDCSCEQKCGIDVLGTGSDGGPGGCVTVAPSPGKRWLRPEGGLPPAHLLPPLPDAIKAALPTRRSEREIEPPVELTPEDQERARRALGSVLDAAVGRVRAGKPGQRHNLLLKAATRVGQVAGAAGLNEDSAEVRGAAAALAEASIASGHDARDAQATAWDGLRWGIAHPAPPRDRTGGGRPRSRREEISDFVARACQEWDSLPPTPRPDLELAEQQVQRGLTTEDLRLLLVPTGVGKTEHITKQLAALLHAKRRGQWDPVKLGLVETEDDEPDIEEAPEWTQVALWQGENDDGERGDVELDDEDDKDDKDDKDEEFSWLRHPDPNLRFDEGPWGAGGARVHPVVVFTPYTQLRDTLARRAGLPDDAVHVGRHAPTQEWEERAAAARERGLDPYDIAPEKGGCYQIGAVDEVACEGHVAAAAVCTTCPNGLAAMEKYGLRRTRDDEGDEGRRSVSPRDKLLARGIDIRDVYPCGHLPALQKLTEQPAIVAASPAATKSLCKLQLTKEEWIAAAKSDDNFSSRRSVPRQTIFDEEPSEWLRTVTVRDEDLPRWEARVTERLLHMLARMQERAERGEFDDPEQVVSAVSEQINRWLEQFCTAISNLQEAVWPRVVPLPPVDLQRVTETTAELAKLERELRHLLGVRRKTRLGDTRLPLTALWEAVRIEWKKLRIDELFAPLRALRALRLAAIHGLLRVTEHQTGDRVVRRLVGVEPNGAGEVLLRGAQVPSARRRRSSTPDVTVATATPSAGLEAAIRALGGVVDRVEIDQPVQVLATFAPGFGKGRSRALAGEAEPQATRRVRQLVGLLAQVHAETARQTGLRPDDIAVISHKDVIERLRESGVLSETNSTWWGRELGTNDLENCRVLVIAGLPTPPPEGWREIYERDRALAIMAGAPRAEWPEWNETREMRPTVEVGGRTIVWPGGLPLDPHLREWMLRWWGDRIAQAIGRLRAVRRGTVRVLVLGPCPDLARHGIRVTPWLEGDFLRAAPPASARGFVRRLEADARVAEAMANGATTNREIVEWLRATTSRGTSASTIRRVRERLRSGETLTSIIEGGGLVVGRALEEGVVRRVRADLPPRVRQAIERGRATRPVPITLKPRRCDEAGAPLSMGDGGVAGRAPPGAA
jgi:hypothetical protein